MYILLFLFCFFFNDTATTEIYTLSLHDALPISKKLGLEICKKIADGDSLLKISKEEEMPSRKTIHTWLLDENKQEFLHNYNISVNVRTDRKSTRLNSSHIPLSRMPSSA